MNTLALDNPHILGYCLDAVGVKHRERRLLDTECEAVTQWIGRALGAKGAAQLRDYSEFHATLSAPPPRSWPSLLPSRSYETPDAAPTFMAASFGCPSFVGM